MTRRRWRKYNFIILMVVGFGAGGLLLLTSRPATAQQPAGQGVVEGQAILATAGSSTSLNALPASLFTFIDGVRQVPPAVSQTDAQGSVRFEQLSTATNVSYTLYIKFGNSIYTSADVAFAAGTSIVSAPVKVYDSTADTGALRVDQHHMIFDLDQQNRALTVVELYLLVNNTDRAIAGDPDSAANGSPVAFRAPIPPGAIIDTIDNRQPNQDIFQSPTQLLDTLPVVPGQSSLVFSYHIPIDRSTLALSIGSPYTTTSLNVLVAPGIVVRSPRLATQASVNAGGRQFQLFTGRELPAGTPIAIELSDLPAPLIPLDVLQWLPLAVVSLALTFALIFAARSKRDDAPSRRQTPT